MIGDKLVISQYHKDNGAKIAKVVLEKLKVADRPVIVTVAGESGSGKSESAYTTAEALEKEGYKCMIFGQDDYFKLPPKSNSNRRREGLDWVGMGEVKLDLLDQHLNAIKDGASEITKPLVFFDEDRIGEETVDVEGVQVAIADGTYTSTLLSADVRAFIDTNYRYTLEHRKKRARDEVEGEFIESVLEIEHGIISKHKDVADIILPRNPDRD